MRTRHSFFPLGGLTFRLAFLGLTFLAFTGAPALAQDVGPRDMVLAFREDMAKAVDGDEEALDRAVARLDLGDFTPGDRERLGRSAAANLYNTLLRVENRVISKLSLAETKDKYSFTTAYGAFLLSKDDEGAWRFAQKTVVKARELYDKARGDPIRGDESEYRDSTTVLREWIPDWLRGSVFLLQNWQWIGLFGLIVLGLIVGTFSRLIAFGVARRVARSRGVELKKERRIGRPFGLVAMAGIWMAGMPFLDLPPTTYTVLMLAARFVMMVGVVWSLCTIVGWISEVLEDLAQQTDTRIDDILVPMVRKAAKLFVIALGIVWIADNMGMNIASLLAGLGIGGLALALASRDTVENFFGAIAILADHPFQVGDWIKMGSIEGTVEAVGFRSTRVRTFYDSVISFPNAMLIRTEVDNLGIRRYRRFKATVGVTYDTPPDRLEAFLEGMRELIRRHPYTRKDYYHVYLNSFGPNSLDILLYVFWSCPDWATELRERQRLLLDIVRLADRLEVQFAFPTRTVHLVQESQENAADASAGLKKPEAKGKKLARDIVEEFTGNKRPPPVDLTAGPSYGEIDADDAADG